jgi:hypothetical protein
MGSQVTAAFITPECRRNKGDEGAWLEACQRLAEAYTDVLAGWAGQPQQPTLNLILTMDRPTSGGDMTQRDRSET